MDTNEELTEILEAQPASEDNATTEECAHEEAAPKEESKDNVQSNPALDEEEGKYNDLNHIKDVLQAISINGMWFRKQLGVIALALFGIILYITNRYQAQQEMIEEERLRSELQDKKFRSMTRNSELTFRCRQSQLERYLKEKGDSTLTPSSEPHYKLVRD